MLTMPYYPDYAVMRPEFAIEVRRYYDFIVRFGVLIHDAQLEDVSYTYTAGVNTEITFEGNVPLHRTEILTRSGRSLSASRAIRSCS